MKKCDIFLRYRPRKTTDYGNSEVEDIIWEVDEDCDGLVDWDNFVLMSVTLNQTLNQTRKPQNPKL